MFWQILIGLLQVLHLISCVILIIVVLLQSGRGSGMAGLLGGSGGDSPLGAKSGTFMGKVTGAVAAFFIVSAVIIAVSSGQLERAGETGTGKQDEIANPEQSGAKPAVPAPDKTEAPETEAPKTDAPKTDAPKPEASKPEAPKTDAPKTDAPKPAPAPDKPAAPAPEKAPN